MKNYNLVEGKVVADEKMKVYEAPKSPDQGC